MVYLESDYDGKALLLSIAIAILLPYVAFHLVSRKISTGQFPGKGWLTASACNLGMAVWASHAVAISAVHRRWGGGHDMPTLLLSLATAVAASWLALFAACRGRQGRMNFLLAGMIMAFGMASMQVTGTATWHRTSTSFDWPLMLSAVLIALAGGTTAWFVMFGARSGDARPVRLGTRAACGAICMALAICGMHFGGLFATGLAAASFTPAGQESGGEWTVPVASLASVFMLAISLLLAGIDGYLNRRLAGLAQSLKQANEQLTYLTLHDSLTQLPNRHLMEDRITQAISSSRRSGKPFAVMYIDIDRFKTFNDSFGPHIGDKLLAAVAQRLVDTLRTGDTIARVGSDEFVVLIKELSAPQKAARIAEKILTALWEPVAVEGNGHNISVSIGISVHPDDGAELGALMLNAESAMVHAKKNGRGNFQFFMSEMNVAATTRLRQENSLRRAMENDEFELYYQPKVAICSGEIVAVEALVRWRHPERGLVSPSEFIPLAEELGLIIPLGAWVLATACQQNRKWQLAGLPPIRVAVNLSAVQFRQKHLVEFVAQILEDTGLDAGYLELEVTESVVMENAEAATLILEKLYLMGVHISIDDFGTGYSSLSYLKSFPLDNLKIDRSFVRDISSDPNDAIIVKSVIALAHSLRLAVTAEGVETPEQLAFLRASGCDEYQGYFRSRPLAAADFESLLRNTAGNGHPANETLEHAGG